MMMSAKTVLVCVSTEQAVHDEGPLTCLLYAGSEWVNSAVDEVDRAQ